MNRTRALSLGLLAAGSLAISAGVFLTFGLGIALMVFGCLLVAADLLVPSR